MNDESQLRLYELTTIIQNLQKELPLRKVVILYFVYIKWLLVVWWRVLMQYFYIRASAQMIERKIGRARFMYFAH